MEQSSIPKKTLAAKPSADTSARIDDDTSSSGIQWQVVPNYEDGEEGTAEWTLKARDEESLSKAQQHLADAITNAEKATHVGFLTLANSNAFPRTYRFITSR